MNYFDTSVFVAAFQQVHARHTAALASLDTATRKTAACSAHTLVELYSVLTRMPPPYRISPGDAIAITDEVQARVFTVTLNASEYIDQLRVAASKGIAGGAIFDAIHIACAKKIGAGTIYTLNRNDFVRIDPALASMILTP